MNNYERLDLYPHNIETVKKVIETYEEGIDTVSTIQATGTGKSYVGLSVALEYKDKKIIWVVPTNAIKEHIEQIINNNPNLSMEIDFPNLEIRTYQSFINMTKEELANIECDFLIVDEIQHLTAPVWGERMDTLVETHPNMIKLGLTAYTTNYRGTIYERDVTNPETDEIFSDSVVNEYDLYDAIIDGVLPKPIVKSVFTEKSEIIIEIKEKIEILKNKGDKTYLEYQKILDDVIRMIHAQNGVKELIKQSIKPDGKYIYFCPIYSEEDKNDMNTIMETIKKYIKEKYPDKKLVFYKTTSADGKKGEYNRECFYKDIDLDGNDVKDCIRIMFAKNQYNEGVHAPNVDGVFLGRRTKSDIVAFEQMGRGLSVRGDTTKKIEEYTKYSLEELIQIANSRGIPIEENTSKEQIIELLVAPIIIDLADNIEFLEELETNLTDRVKEIREQGPGNERIIKITDTRIDISVINKDLLLVLQKVRENLRSRTWDDTYNLLVAYYNEYGNTEVPKNFITKDGITESLKKDKAINLWQWCNAQRTKQGNLTPERRKKLEMIGFRFENKIDLEWERKYKLVKKYYESYGHLNMPYNFMTVDGINEAKEGEEGAVNLYVWCIKQRTRQKNLSLERKRKLALIGFRFESFKNILDLEWKRKYQLAKAYYEAHGHSDVPTTFITKDGVTEATKEEIGAVDLGGWCCNQRNRQDKLSKEKKEKLARIKFRFNNKRTLTKMEWDDWYNLAVIYYQVYGNSNIPNKFITADGITEATKDETGTVDLGAWCIRQRQNYNNLSEEKRKKLETIEFRFEDKLESEWERKYQLLVTYYKHYGNSDVKQDFITIDGITRASKDEEGAVALGAWCNTQRRNYKNLSEERRKKLEAVGFRFEDKDELEWERKYQLLVKFYNYYGNSDVKQDFKTVDGVTKVTKDEEGAVALGSWCNNQRQNELSEERRKKLETIKFRFEDYDELEWERKYKLLEAYFETYGNSDVPSKFITKDGINRTEKDEEGAVKLGSWCERQRNIQNELSEKRRKKLEAIKFRFEDKDELEWERKYQLLVNYYGYYGNSDVNSDFITVDGITKSQQNEEGRVKLGQWCGWQRQKYNNLSEEKRKKLEAVGFRVDDKRELEWEKKYQLAKAYYEYYGHSNIPSSFVTKDGINKAEKGEVGAVKLGGWCVEQRANQEKLTPQRRRKLELIGFRFIKKIDHDIKITELCNKYNLDYKKNKFLMKIPYQELYAKIEYLMDNNLPLQIDGEINPIFSMSNVNMQIQYGISKEELITKYYLNKRKGV